MTETGRRDASRGRERWTATDEPSPEEAEHATEDDAANAPVEKKPATSRLLIAILVTAAVSAGLALALSRSFAGGAAAIHSEPSGAALVGAWTCSKAADGFQFEERMVFLDAGRYTRQHHSTRPGESFMSMSETTGSWELKGDLLLLTVDSCAEYSPVKNATEPCLPSHTLFQTLKLPIGDTLPIGKLCSDLKRR